MKKNVLLIIPKPLYHQHLTPLGPLYVAGQLRAKGMSVSILDFNTQKVSLKEELGKTFPSFCVLCTSFRFYGNCPSSTLKQTIDLAKEIKVLDSTIATIAIGPLSSLCAEHLIEQKKFDFVINGEPDFAICNLLQTLGENENTSSLKGLCCNRNGKISFSQPEAYPNLEQLERPARDLVDFKQYVFDSYFSEKVVSILSSRGCPFYCSFCFISRTSQLSKCNVGTYYRKIPARKVVDEILFLIEKYHIKGVKFEDPEFCVDREHVKEICELILKNKLSIHWKCQSRAKGLDSEMLLLMKKAGCRSIYFGVETANQKILEGVNKGVSLKDIRETFSLCQKIGIKADASFLLGLPGEDWSSVKETVDFAKKLNPNIATFHIFTPFLGCEIFPHKNVLSDESLDVYHSYNFSVCSLTSSQLEKARKYAYRSFYFRPIYIARIIKQMINEKSMRYFLFSSITKKQESYYFKKLLIETLRR